MQRSLLVGATFLLMSGIVQGLVAQAQQGSGAPPTLQVTSRLVFLDITVLDKKGRPVLTGLTKDDFQITEDKRPQKIFSFEPPETHTVDSHSAQNPDGKAPADILVMDMLNSSFSDVAFIRYEVQRYLTSQPSELKSPTELMVVGNESLELAQGLTRNRDELLDALRHIPTALPYKEMSASFWPERFNQSIQALRQIALETGGVPGRKNIIWVGHGGPGINSGFFEPQLVEKIQQYVHDTANLMVNSRVSLFVIYPGLKVQPRGMGMSPEDAMVDLGDSDPFAGDINFGVFVNETGGKLFYNRNDVDAEMRQSERFGAEYYTLTYQPHGGDDNGRFRRIRVTLRDPNLHAVTKAGYYAPDKNRREDSQQAKLDKLFEAMVSTIPFTAVHPELTSVVRHADTESAELTVRLHTRNLGWLENGDGKSAAGVIVAVGSLSSGRSLLASRVLSENLTVSSANPQEIAHGIVSFNVSVPVPRKAKFVRVAVMTESGGRIGTAEVDRRAIDAAPLRPTPEPQLAPAHRSSPSGI